MDCKKMKLHAKIGDIVHIIFLGDNHEGAKNHNKEKFIQAVNKIIEIRRKPGHHVVVVGMGDYIDCIHHKDNRFHPAEIAEKYEINDLKDLPNKQMETFLDDVRPIMDSFGAWLYGNHEMKYIKHNSSNPVKPIKYYYEYKMDEDMPILGESGWLDLGIIRSNKNRKTPHFRFLVRMHHGTGGGGFREGYPINKVHDIFRWDIADIYCMGHLHQLATDAAPKKTFINGKEIIKKSLYGVTGCFLHKSRKGSHGYYEGKPGKYPLIGMLDAQIKVGETKTDCELKWDRLVF